MQADTIVPVPFQHKLNYFLFCRTFEILFIICAEILIKSKVQLSSFEPQIFFFFFVELLKFYLLFVPKF
jgi:hypothetical protein